MSDIRNLYEEKFALEAKLRDINSIRETRVRQLESINEAIRKIEGDYRDSQSNPVRLTDPRVGGSYPGEGPDNALSYCFME